MTNDPSVGRPPRVSDEEILEVFRRAETPVLTTTQAADRLPIGSRGLLTRLDRLVEEGRLERMAVGPRGQVWWIPEESVDDEPAYLAGFGRYDGTNVAESVDAVSRRFDRDVRNRR